MGQKDYVKITFSDVLLFLATPLQHVAEENADLVCFN